MISSYGDQSTTEINPSYYYRASNAASIALNASRDTLCSIHAIATSGKLIEMVLLSIFFTHESDPRRDHQQVFFIHFVAQ